MGVLEDQGMGVLEGQGMGVLEGQGMGGVGGPGITGEVSMYVIAQLSFITHFKRSTFRPIFPSTVSQHVSTETRDAATSNTTEKCNTL